LAVEAEPVMVALGLVSSLRELCLRQIVECIHATAHPITRLVGVDEQLGLEVN
jgi:hypothetical protein